MGDLVAADIVAPDKMAAAPEEAVAAPEEAVAAPEEAVAPGPDEVAEAEVTSHTSLVVSLPSSRGNMS